MKRLALFLLLLAIPACAAKDTRALSGYVEADMLMMAPQDAGVVAELAVTEGDRVAAGALLFRLDPDRAAHALAEAEANAASAKARAAKAGALDQAVAEAEADYERARKTYERSKELVRTKVATAARLDNDRAAFDAAKARVERARAERDAATGAWRAADAAVALARRRLDDMRVVAPKAGVIERVYRRPGEVVAPGDPVVALLPPENLKLRFYAPEALISSLRIGGKIAFSCDGCARRTGTISFIATEPEFTPPVIYSLEEREKLVFLVEARPDDPEGLRPGLPVEVSDPRKQALETPH